MSFHKIQFTLLFLLSFVLFSSCDDDSEDMQPQNAFSINESIRGWILPFDAVGKEFTYLNSANEEAKVTVIVRPTTENSFVDCQRDGNTVQCEFENVALEFSSDTLAHLTAILFGEDRLTLNYADNGGLTPEIIRYIETGREFEVPQSDNFEVMFEENFAFDNTTHNAFIINTISLEGLFATTPPNSFIFVKGIGIVEWTDYAGETWMLSN